METLQIVAMPHGAPRLLVCRCNTALTSQALVRPFAQSSIKTETQSALLMKLALCVMDESKVGCTDTPPPPSRENRNSNSCTTRLLCSVVLALRSDDDKSLHIVMVQVESGGSIMRDVPMDLLAEVLRHIGQRDRISCCLLVEKKWQQAVMMATTSIVCTARSDAALRSLSAWLTSNEHATKIRDLGVTGLRLGQATYSNLTVDLPLWNLTHIKVLQLTHCNLKVTPVDSTKNVTRTLTAATASPATSLSGSLAALTALSRLALKDTLLDLSTIGSLPALQHLDLCRVGHSADPATPNCRLSAASAALGHSQDTPYGAPYDIPSMWVPQLSQLTQLTYLAVAYSPFEIPTQPAASAITACLSSLQCLQRLELNIVVLKATYLGHLPASLTALSLCEVTDLNPDTLPNMQQLTNLQSLQLIDAQHFDPAVLSTLIHLTQLYIIKGNFRAATVTAEQCMEERLMAALQGMTQLQQLDLSDSLQNEFSKPEMYAALTASSKLVHLILVNCKFPSGARDFVFPVSSPTKALQVVRTAADLVRSDLGRLAFSCPALEHLEIVAGACLYPYARMVSGQVSYPVIVINLSISKPATFAGGGGVHHSLRSPDFTPFYQPQSGQAMSRTGGLLFDQCANS